MAIASLSLLTGRLEAVKLILYQEEIPTNENQRSFKVWSRGAFLIFGRDFRNSIRINFSSRLAFLSCIMSQYETCLTKPQTIFKSDAAKRGFG